MASWWSFGDGSRPGIFSVEGDALKVRALLIDLDGVVYTGDRPVPGALEALQRLGEMGIPYRFVANTTRRSRASIAGRLAAMGFPVPPVLVINPPAAAAAFIRAGGGGPVHLLATGDVHRDFEEAGLVLLEDGAAWVVGDAGDSFTYAGLTRAFRELLAGARLLALEKDRYWMGPGGLQLSAGPFVAALEFAAGTRAEVMGKPSPRFFGLALRELGAAAGETAMVGDDALADTAGAMQCGMQGILVRTGKFREEALREAPLTPTAVLGSLADLPGYLIKREGGAL
jgi:HAD superfamily hydrolase (TIGR01458 family)